MFRRIGVERAPRKKSNVVQVSSFSLWQRIAFRRMREMIVVPFLFLLLLVLGATTTSATAATDDEWQPSTLECTSGATPGERTCRATHVCFEPSSGAWILFTDDVSGGLFLGSSFLIDCFVIFFLFCFCFCFFLKIRCELNV